MAKKTNSLTAEEAAALIQAWDLEQESMEDIEEHSEPAYTSAVKKLFAIAGIDMSPVGSEGEEEEEAFGDEGELDEDDGDAA
jgi:hypothetical protein